MDITEFLESSPIARNTQLPGCVVLKRFRMSLAELSAVKTEGTFDAGVVDSALCELEIGGQVVATGSVYRRRGRAYFKITHTSPSDGHNKEEADA